MRYQSVRTECFKYIHYLDLKSMDELYDLYRDPYELKNVIGEKWVRPLLRHLDAEREQLLEAAR